VLGEAFAGDVVVHDLDVVARRVLDVFAQTVESFEASLRTRGHKSPELQALR
jgi:hypothetical protein